MKREVKAGFWAVVCMSLFLSSSAWAGMSFLYWPADWTTDDPANAIESDTGLWGLALRANGDRMFSELEALYGNFTSDGEDLAHGVARLDLGWWIRLPRSVSPRLLGVGLGYTGSVGTWDETVTYTWGRSTWEQTETQTVGLHGPVVGVKGEAWLSEYCTEAFKDSSFEDFDFGFTYGYWYSPLQMATGDVDDDESNGKCSEYSVALNIAYQKSMRVTAGMRNRTVEETDHLNNELDGAFFEFGFLY